MRTKDQWLVVMENMKGGYAHSDDIEQTYMSGIYAWQRLERKGFIADGNRILDVGCGNGRLVIPLIERNVEYVGFDIEPACIEFCNMAFAPYPNFTFHLIDIQSEQYNPNGSLPRIPSSVRFPDGPFDLVLASSVFTHIETLEMAQHYINEVKRVLVPGGRLYSTWFRDPPHTVCNESRKTVFKEADIINLLNDFHINCSERGFTNEFHDQWFLYSVFKG